MPDANSGDLHIRHIPPSLLRYLAVGVVNTLVGLGTILAAMHILGLGDVRANMLGYAVGIICSFTLNKYWTFSSRQSVSRELGRFLLVTAVAYSANLVTLIVLTRVLRTNRDLAQALAILPYVTVGYVGSRFFAFRQQVPDTV